MIEKPRNILIVGGGAREHAIGWKIREDSSSARLYFAPGNGGTKSLGRNIDIDTTDLNRLVNFSVDKGIDLAVIGPERPLSMGLVDELTEIPAFGPTKAAARLESSKSFATDFMKRHKIPYPETEVFDDPRKAQTYIDSFKTSTDFVIKADGLAEGKAVILPKTWEEATEAIRRMMIDREFGEAGEKILIQKRLIGKEVSAVALVSNEVVMLPPARDYKNAFNGNEGPNTGGMGAYSPSESISDEELSEIYHSIFLPARRGMIEEETPFKGALYAGLMMTEEGPQVLEFNARFGDPETQVQLRRVRSNFLNLLESTANETLTDQIKVSREQAVGVVIASIGYPGNFEKGKKIQGLRGSEGDIVVFHAGTREKDGGVITSGGRVLTVTATGKTRESAREKAYDWIEKQDVAGEWGFYRTDIGS